MHLYKDNSYHCILICIIVASSPHLAICAWKHFYPVEKNKTSEYTKFNQIYEKCALACFLLYHCAYVSMLATSESF